MTNPLILKIFLQTFLQTFQWCKMSSSLLLISLFHKYYNYSYFLIFSSGCSLNITKRWYYIHYKYITWHGGKGSMIAMQIKKDFKVSIFAKHITTFPSPCNGRFKSKELFSNHLKTQIIDGNIILVNIAIIYYIVINFVIVYREICCII